MGENRHLFLQSSTTSQYVGQMLDATVTRAGLPAFLLAILTHVRDLQPVSPTEISRASGSPMTTLRDNIQRLVDRGLVRRTPNPVDGRSYRLRLTARGAAVMHAADPALLEAYEALEHRLPRPREEYERALDELNAALELALDDVLRRGAVDAGPS